MSTAIALGILQLHFPSDRDTSHTDWLQSHDFLTQVPPLAWIDRSTNDTSLLRDVLDDEGLGLTLSWKDTGRERLVRVSVILSDADGSLWWDKNRNKAARTKNLQKLFAKLENGWSESDGDKVLCITDEEVNLDMPTLYANIESPPEPYESLSAAGGIDPELAYTLQSYDSPQGLSAVLTPYQVRSLSRMLAMETEPDSILDPRYIALSRQDAVDKEEEFYYLDTKTYEVVSTVQRRSFPRGGILCEEMGSGKTCMMLSLVVATLQNPCQPPPNHSYHHPKHKAENRLPTLVEICTSLITKQSPEMDLSEELPHLDLHQEQYRGLPRYMGWTQNESIRARWGHEVGKKEVEMSVVNASLVIVPAILVAQWQDEIKKHVHEGVVKVLLLTAKGGMPSLETLAEYDVILMDVEIFKREAKKDNSILLKARWKRIILDEGSTASAKTSGSNLFANKLSVERRWLISGTPTRNLKQGTDGAMLVDSKVDLEIEALDGPARKQWSNTDTDDATRIGNMIGGFLDGDLFPGLSTNFQQSITNPLVRSSGPGFGAVARMKELLRCVMVKHRTSDINKDVDLPPLSISTVRLAFDPLQRITYNVMIAYILANLIMKKKGSTYNILHNRNPERHTLVQNLRIACTWYTGDASEVDYWIDAIQEWMEDETSFLLPKKKGCEAVMMEREEREGVVRRLKLIMGYLEGARDDEIWMGANKQGTGSVLFDVDLGSEVVGAWSDAGEREREEEDVDMGEMLIGGDALVAIRKYNLHGTGLDAIVDEGGRFREAKYGDLVNKQEKERKAASNRRKNTVKGKGKGKAKATIRAVARPIAPVPRKNATASCSKSSIVMGEGDDINGEEGQKGKKEKTGASTKQDVNLIDQPRPLPESIQTFSRSAKINWVLNTLINADVEDKFIIFGSLAETKAVGEVLELADIKASFFTKAVTRVKRETGLKEFEGPDVRVCLMELGLAAQGLTLIMANRMIFLSPVWTPDVQAQASKKKRCKVEILVMEGTVEEIIVGRRPGSEGDETSYTKSLIERAKFVTKEEMPDERFTFRFAPVDIAVKREGKGKRKRKRGQDDEEDAEGEEGEEDEEPVKKKTKQAGRGKKAEGQGDSHENGETGKKGKGKEKYKGKNRDGAEDGDEAGLDVAEIANVSAVEDAGPAKKKKTGKAKHAKGERDAKAGGKGEGKSQGSGKPKKKQEGETEVKIEVKTEVM